MGAAAAALDYDAQLMLRVREGDSASFGLLLEKHRAPVINFVHRMVPEPGIAEELAQEVFLRVYRARSSYEPTAAFKTWLFRIAAHMALNWLRDQKHERGNEISRGARFPMTGPLSRKSWSAMSDLTRSGER
jgi:RNA polymerase sigma-70 factor (ECF subfamily)